MYADLLGRYAHPRTSPERDEGFVHGPLLLVVAGEPALRLEFAWVREYVRIVEHTAHVHADGSLGYMLAVLV